MQSTEKVLNLKSVFGVEARITTPSSATGGAYVEMDCTVVPGGRTIYHFHPQQEESYRVLEGTLDVRRDGKWTTLREGEYFEIPAGTVHGWRNTAKVPVRFINIHRPALGFQDHMETLHHLVNVGKIKGTKDLRSIIYMSMSAVRHKPDVAVDPPQGLVNAMAFIGRSLGWKLDA
jgi:mannose-6-phosphate isomerase-like protein (cupin superfamily)